MAEGRGGSSSEDSSMTVVLVSGILMIGIYALYAANREVINHTLIYISMGMLWPFTFIFPHAAADFKTLSSVGNVKNLTLSVLFSTMGQAAFYIKWLFVPIYIWIAYHLYFNVGWFLNYVRSFDMKSLAKHNVKFAQCLTPVVMRGEEIINEPTATGRWRVAEAPMLFALRHKIIKNIEGEEVPENHCFSNSGLPRRVINVPEGGFIFDRKKAGEVYEQRMGPKIQTALHMGKMDKVKEMPDYIIGLIGAFCAFGLANRKAGQAILDSMSSSFNEEGLDDINKEDVFADIGVDIKDAEAWIKKALHKRSDSDSSSEANLAATLQEKLSLHNNWLFVWMGILLVASRRHGGTIPPAEFLWLRPTNRALWYYLCVKGGTGVFAEGAGPWGHEEAENVLGKSIAIPYVDNSVDALYQAIEDESWFNMEHKKEEPLHDDEDSAAQSAGQRKMGGPKKTKETSKKSTETEDEFSKPALNRRATAKREKS